MVHALTINPSVLFQIRLQEDTLTLRGSPSESVGCVLRGQLVLALTEFTKIRDVRLTFTGQSKVNWLQGFGANQTYTHEKRIIYQHEWVFLEPQKNFHMLKPDNYTWDFELILPGTLPETVNRCECGYVQYELKAVAERPTFAKNLRTQRPVRVLRCLPPASDECIQGMALTDVWSNRVGYEIVLPTKAFTPGDDIPIEICLQPLLPGLHVNQFVCKLQEHISCVAKDKRHDESRTVRIIRDYDSMWNTTKHILIPTTVVCDSQNDIISVKHRVEFCIFFAKEDGTISELRASLPIMVLPVPPHGDDMDLPAYEEQHYFNQSFFTTTDESLSGQPSSSSSSSSPLCSTMPLFFATKPPTSSSIEGDEEPMNFDLQELTRLPSYQSVVSQIPAPLVDLSLPPMYNACVQGH